MCVRDAQPTLGFAPTTPSRNGFAMFEPPRRSF
jgi:hypothetical protein